jgi:hypothetical protein
MSEQCRKYTHEFKDEAAKMVIETSCPIAEIARKIRVNEVTHPCRAPTGDHPGVEARRRRLCLAASLGS